MPLGNSPLTHWGRVTHICVGTLTITGSDNGLSPGRRQAITWTNVEILLTGPLGTNSSEMLIEIHIFLFKKIHLKMSPGKWRPFCLGLNVLARPTLTQIYVAICRWTSDTPLPLLMIIQLTEVMHIHASPSLNELKLWINYEKKQVILW